MQRIAEGIEEKLGPSQIADAASKGASQVVDALDSMISGIAAAAKTITEDPRKSDPSDPPAEEPSDKPDA